MHHNDYLVTAVIRFIVPADSESEAEKETLDLFEGIRAVESCIVNDVRQI